MMALLGGGLICALLATATLGRLRTPMRAVLTELCAGPERAQFWWRVFSVSAVTGTALCTSLATLGLGRSDAWQSIAEMVRGGCIGLMASLAAAATAVLAFQRELARTGDPRTG
jgi:hypothetical protein